MRAKLQVDRHGTYTVKCRQSAPTSATLPVGPGGEGRMGESYLPHSVLHEEVLAYEGYVCVSYADQRSRAGRRTDPSKPMVCAIPGQEGVDCCVHFQPGRARVCSGARHHPLQSHTRILTSLTRSQGWAHGRFGGLLRYMYTHELSAKFLCACMFVLSSGRLY